MNRICIIFSFGIGILGITFFYLIILINSFFCGSCNLSITSNRNYQKYYGLNVNHFGQLKAEDISSAPFYTGILPEEIINYNSFIVYADRGAGKTLIRQQIKRKLDERANTFVIELYNAEISDGIKYFISNLNATNFDEVHEHWKEKNVAELILSRIVTQYVTKFYEVTSKFSYPWKNVNLEDRIRLTAIFCLYFNGDYSENLENIVNDMFNFRGWFSKGMSYTDISILGSIDPHTGMPEIVPKFQEIQRDAFNILILSKDRIPQLRLYYGISKKINRYIKNTSIEPLTTLRWLAKIFQKLYKIKISIIIDGLDESSYFFDKATMHIKNIEVFINSTVDTRLQSLFMESALEFYLFYPSVKGQEVNWNHRTDKIPVIELQWTPDHLINYANLLLDDMRNRSTCYCKLIPHFEDLVNITESMKIFQKIRHPRDLNLLMQKLEIVLTANVGKSKQPFKATKSDVIQAYQMSCKNMLNIDC